MNTTLTKPDSAMRLTDILKPDCVKVPLQATDKQSAINELADLLTAQCGLSCNEDLRTAIWQREQTRTTGIGHGIGIPHGKCAGVDELRMAIGKADTPIEFGAIDGKPVTLILLLASPQDQTGPHIQALARISRLLTDEQFRADLLACDDAASMYDLIAQRDQS